MPVQDGESHGMIANRKKFEALQGRVHEIAEAWCNSFASRASGELASRGVRQRCKALAEQLAVELVSPGDEPKAFREIGRALADLGLSDPEQLGTSLSLLSKQLVSDLPQDSLGLMLPRVAAMIGEVSKGCLERAAEGILLEREELRSAHDLSRRELVKAIRRSEEKYRALVESANQAIFIVDERGVFRFMNGSAARQLGGDASNFIGKSMWDLFPPDTATRHLANVLKTLETKEPMLSESETILQGKRHWRETSLQPLQNEEGEYGSVLGISTDITERKNAESSLRAYSERLRIMREIDRSILAAQSTQAIAQATLDHVRRLLPVSGGAVILVDPGGSSFQVLAGELGRLKAAGTNQFKNSDGDVDRVWESAMVLDADYVATHHARTFELLRREAGQQLLIVPLIVHQEMIGALALDLEDHDACNEEHLEAAREIGAALAIAIQNAKLLEAERAALEENGRLLGQIQSHANTLEEQVAERTRDLSALYAVTAVANEYLDVKSLLEKSLERVTEALGCQAASIHLTVDESGKLELYARAGNWISQGNDGCMDASSDTLAGRVYTDDAPVMHTGQFGVTGRAALETKQVPTVSAGVPMHARGDLLGVLCVFCSRRNAFSESDITLLGTIADQVGAAMENARLRDRSEQGAVRLERDRLARELHDSVTQALYSLTLFAEAALDRTRDEQMHLVQEHLEEIELTAHQALKEMRLLLYELRSTPVVPEGLTEALRHRLDAVETRTGIQAQLVTGSLDGLSRDAEEGLYRIAQEALNNVLKHADAATVTVEVRDDLSAVCMEISDDGRGFDLDAVLRRGGMGLSTMRERAEFLGGSLSIASEPGKGTRVQVKIDKEAITG